MTPPLGSDLFALQYLYLSTYPCNRRLLLVRRRMMAVRGDVDTQNSSHVTTSFTIHCMQSAILTPLCGTAKKMNREKMSWQISQPSESLWGVSQKRRESYNHNHTLYKLGLLTQTH